MTNKILAYIGQMFENSSTWLVITISQAKQYTASLTKKEVKFIEGAGGFQAVLQHRHDEIACSSTP